MERLLRHPPKPLMRLVLWLILGNLLVATVLIAGTALNLHHSRATEEGIARQAAENLSNSLSIEIGAELRLIDNALATIAARYREARAPESRQILAEMLAQQRDLLPHVTALRAADAQGAVEMGLARDELPISIKDRPYFELAKRTDMMVMSEPLPSRVTGQWCIILARRILTVDGQFAGIVYAMVTADHFTDRFQMLALGDSGAISLRTDSMRLIARHSAAAPRSTKGYGEVTVSNELKRKLGESRESGWYITPTALDNVERITAYRKIPGYPMLVLTGMSTEEFLAPWRRSVVQQSVLVACIILTIAGFSIYLFFNHRHERNARMHATRLARQQNLMLENELVGMIRIRGDTIEWGNRAVSNILGYTARELHGASTRELYLDDASHAQVCEGGVAALKAGVPFRAQIQMRKIDGEPIWIDLSGMAVSETESLWMLVDIDALKRSEAKAYDLALRDALTGLPNRRLFEEKLDDVLANARRGSQHAAVCYLDLDGFKPINDTHGHEAGDAVLREVGSILLDTVRGNDVVARLGGDEFAIVLSSVSTVREAMQVMQRCRDRIHRRISLSPGIEVSVDASIGIAIGDGMTNPSDLMRRADEAMYSAKRSGKGRVHVWKSHSTTNEGLHLVAEVA